MPEQLSGLHPIRDSFLQVRQRSVSICGSLEIEDFVVQSIPEASPVKWHLAHTTWFFETFVLEPFLEDFKPFHPFFGYLFNSYYHQAGERHPRSERGMLSRPTLEEVLRYRARVEQATLRLLAARSDPEVHRRVVLGNHHEQQHQELILTDIKTCLGRNPLLPALRGQDPPSAGSVPDLEYTEVEGGQVRIGALAGLKRFHFDNEGPEHIVTLRPFSIANRLVSNGEYLDFVLAGGYDDPVNWLSDGWTERTSHRWSRPEYWFLDGKKWREYTLYGPMDLDPNNPVTHVSFYEADAYARWLGARLPTEFEWEHAARCLGVTDPAPGYEDESLHPRGRSATGCGQFFGDCWQWTASAYGPYPGFRPTSDALGEYNGKFMANQMVLRGSSCATPTGHERLTYRNFFYPKDRWQFTGIRLARDLA